MGRYDIMIEPKKAGNVAFIIEFKVVYAKGQETMEDGVKAALQQIAEKQYFRSSKLRRRQYRNVI